MLKMPLGSFARSRKDWTLETLRYGSLSTNGQGGNFTPIYSLSNDAKDGTKIAVWGILAWYTSVSGMMFVNSQPGQKTPANGLDQQLIPGTPAIPGFTNLTVDTSTGLPTAGLVFKADGSHWFTNGDVPLIVLPANWRAIVYSWVPVGAFNPGGPSAVTFLWGPYSTARGKR